jgi:DNA-binding SARP family transcriptional activator/WD40 repeat protein
VTAGGSVRVRVLGPASVDGKGGLAPRDRQVLAALVVEAGRVCPADRLAEALYGESPPATWRKVVHGSVGRLRRLLGDHAIVTTGSGYRFELGDDEIDVRRFERLVGDAESLTAVGEHERAALSLRAAIELAVGEPLVDLDGWEPAMAVAARYRELARQAEEQLVRAELASGRHQVALAAASELVVREPLREQRWAALALAQYRVGRQGEALRTIRRARQVLADELGLGPGPELVALERSILAQDPGLTGPPAVAGWHSGGCPYRGLAAYDVGDGEWFFGRDREIAECLGIVDATGFVAIVGASGSGKSSLARAGVAPALRRDGRDAAVVVPGADPERTLDGVPKGSVLVVDQLEELFVTCDDDQARVRFAAAVVRWSSAAPVVVTLRADHLGPVAELSDLAARVQAGVFLLGAMGEPELRSAIEGPAIKAGLRLEPGLVDLLAHDVAGQPGALPLLSHALAETYERREGPVLTTAGYRAVGGVQGAVARAADEVIDSLPPDGRRVARDLFLRLVTAPETSDPVRQRIPRAALTADPATEAVLDALVRTRLVIADAETVEVAHEAVCRAWPRLRDWIDEDRDGIRTHQHLTRSAQDWEQSARESSELYRGARLAAALEWAGGGIELNPSERDFLDASATQRDAEERAAHDQLRRQQRVNRRLRTALAGVGVVLVLALVAGVVAWRQRDRADAQAVLSQIQAERADTQAALAEAEADRADAEAEQAQRQAERADIAAAHAEEAAAAAEEQRAAAEDAARNAQIEALVGRAESIRETQRDAAALLAVEAYRLADTARTRSALFASFTKGDGFLDAHRLEGTGLGSSIVLPDDTAYLIDQDGRLRGYDLDTGALGEAFPELAGRPDLFSVLAASRDGALVAQAAWVEPDAKTRIGIYDTRTRKLRVPPAVVDGLVHRAEFTDRGDSLLLAVGPAGRLVVLDTATGAHVETIAGVPVGKETGPSAVTVADDKVVIGSINGTIRILDAATFELERTITLAPQSVANLHSVGDGTMITSGAAGLARVNLADGAIGWQFDEINTCFNMTVVANRGTFYCGDLLGHIAEREIRTGLVLRRLDAQSGNSGPLWPARGGTELVNFSANEPVVARWRLDGSGPITDLVAPGYRPLDFDPTGTRLLIERGSFPNIAAGVVDVQRGDLVRHVPGLYAANWFDEDTLVGAAINADGTPELTRTDLRGDELVADGFLFDPIPSEYSYDTGKQRALLQYQDGTRPPTITSFDPVRKRTGPLILAEGVRPVQSHRYSPDRRVWMAISLSGHRIALGTSTGIRLYDGFTGNQLGRIPAPARGVFITVTDQLFVGSYGGDLTQYDLDTLRPVRPFGGTVGFAQALVGTADGTLVATKGGDRKVTLHDVATGVALGKPITIAEDENNGIALSPDGLRLAVGGEPADGRHAIQIWDLDPEHWETAACRIAGRNLTRDEWDAIVGDLAPYHATCPDLPIDD